MACLFLFKGFQGSEVFTVYSARNLVYAFLIGGSLVFFLRNDNQY